MAYAGGFATASAIGIRTVAGSVLRRYVPQLLVPDADNYEYCRQDFVPAAGSSGWSVNRIYPRFTGGSVSLTSLIENPAVRRLMFVAREIQFGASDSAPEVSFIVSYLRSESDTWSSFPDPIGVPLLAPDPSHAPAGNPAMVYNPGFRLELVSAMQDNSLLHYFRDAALTTGGWEETARFGIGDGPFTGIAMIYVQSIGLMLIGAHEDRIDLYVHTFGRWGSARTIWRTPQNLTIVGLPALWQELLPPVFQGPFALRTPPGDFLIAAPLSDNSVRILRLSYAAYGTAMASQQNVIPIDMEPVRRMDGMPGMPQPIFHQVQAVSLIQIPPSPFSISGWFVRRPLNVFCWFLPNGIVQQYVESGAVFMKTTLDVPTYP